MNTEQLQMDSRRGPVDTVRAPMDLLCIHRSLVRIHRDPVRIQKGPDYFQWGANCFQRGPDCFHRGAFCFEWALLRIQRRPFEIHLGLLRIQGGALDFELDAITNPWPEDFFRRGELSRRKICP